MDFISTEWSGQTLSRVALGCELLGGSDWGKVDLDEAARTVRAAYDAGVTVFDTADVYGLGKSEQRLAEALGPRLSDVIVVTKGGVTWDSGDMGSGRSRTWRDLGRSHMRQAVQASLRRLGLERIPVYLAHWPDGSHGVEDVVGTLTEFREEGLIGAFGLSNFGVPDLCKPQILERIQALEAQHSLLSPATDLFTALKGWTGARLLYGTLGQGLLTGKYPADHVFATDDRRHRLPQFTQDRPGYERLLEELAGASLEAGVSQSCVAMRWALESAPGSTVVVGARNRRQLADLLAGIEAPLPVSIYERLSAVAS